jgi:hypothetical protein
MRGLNDRMQRKMATCIDLSYGRAVSTALTVEAKYAGSRKSKVYGGDRPSQGSEKRQRSVIRPFTPNRFYHVHPPTLSSNRSSFAPPLPPPQQISRVPLVLVSLPSPALQQAALIVESSGTSSRTAPTPSRIDQIISRVLGVPPKGREMRQTIPRAKI